SESVIEGMACSSLSEPHSNSNCLTLFSHRKTRIPESLEQFFQASGIANRHQAEKIGPPLFGVVAGILGHFLAFERHKSLHGSVRGITLAEVPERRRQTGENFIICPGNPGEAVDRVSKIAFQICAKSECEKTGLRHERVKFERFSGVA